MRALVAIAVASVVLAPQARGSGAIAGVVTDRDGTAVPGAEVRAADESSSVQMTTRAGEAGQFAFTGVPAGRFVLLASADGYLPGRYGAFAHDEPGVPLRVEAGPRIEDVRITLDRPAAVGGRVTDADGRPVLAAVHAMLTSPVGVTRPPSRAATARTDAEGRYTVPGLAPGTYLILAMPLEAPAALRGGGETAETALVPTFYPGVTSVVTAAPIALGVGDTAAGLDIVVIRAPVTSLTAVLTRDGRDPDGYLALLVWPEDAGEVGLQVDTSPSPRPLGVGRVQAGRHVVIASALEAPTGDRIERLWTTYTVDVDARAPVEISIALATGASIEGRLTFEGQGGGGAELPETWLWPIEPGRPDGILPFGGTVLRRPTGAFEVTGIAPGRYVLQFGRDAAAQAAGWSVSRVVTRGEDIADLPLDLGPGERLTDVEVVLTNRVSEIAGTLTDTDGRPRFDVTLVAFAADSRYWWDGTRRIRLARPDTSGFYLMRGLPAGEYFLAAVTGRLPGTPTDPQWLSGLSAGAVPVLVATGGRTVQDLRVGR